VLWIVGDQSVHLELVHAKRASEKASLVAGWFKFDEMNTG
jgi:hypothetical protein